MRIGTFQSNGINLIYDTEGSGDETVLVVHGGPGLPHEYFHPLLSTLGRYVKLVYFDRRADILSSSSPHEIASLGEMADDIDALRKSLGLSRVTLLGHSFGGAIALTYALRYPDHVKRLILVSASAFIENPEELEKRLMKTLSAEEMAAYNSSEGNVAGSPCDRVRRRYRALYPHYFHKQPDKEGLDRGVYSIYFDSLARKLVYTGNEDGFDVRAQLGKIKAPTLVITGRYDMVTPLTHGSELANGLPYSRLAVMEHSGHFPFVEENYLFTQWVWQFIAATTDSSDDQAFGTRASTSADGSR